MKSDRILGAVVIIGALAFAASASTIPTNFLSGPVGSKVFPMVIGITAAICGAVMFLRPDEEPGWPSLATLGSLLFATIVMTAYAYSLKPLGFLVPTAIASAVLSFQIQPRARFAVLAGIGLSLGLFILFRYGLGLSLFAFPRTYGG